MKVLIADDERIIRDTISQLVNWESLGLTLIGQCENGIEAYDMIIDESPDIVMTDIKMPGLSGLDLIKKVTGTRMDTQFIVLSGYSEFKYAQEAMKYGVKHYLLKPCNVDQITESLQAAIEECNNKKAISQFSEKQELSLESQTALVKDLCTELRDLQKKQEGNYRELQKQKLFELFRCLNGVSDIDDLFQLCSFIYFRLSDESLFCSLLETVELMQKLKQIDNPDKLRSAFFPELERIIQNAPLGQFDKSTIVTRVKEYVYEHLSDPDMTLKWIAENHLYMNVDYVSRRFVRETGEKFSTYLNNIRIQRAKEILSSDATTQIQNIAEEVGCGNNPQYFSQLFKKNTGMTPTAYTKTVQNKAKA